jgi:hypothetical protein
LPFQPAAGYRFCIASKFCWGGVRSVAFDVALNITQLQQGNGFPDVTATGSRQFSLTYLVPDGLVCE